LSQEPNRTRLEEVVVTAERRLADAQRTPISISVLSRTQLDATGAQTTADLQHLVPGLVFKTNTVLGQPYIRGVGSDIISAGADPSVATYVDDVYQARAIAAFQTLYDLDRVEVVKGPQGTLFGRNVTGGAVRLFSRRPEPEFSTEGDVLLGSYDQVRLRGVLNAPVRGDGAILRLSGVATQRDGYTRNLLTGGTIDDEDLRSVRTQLQLGATGRVKTLLIAESTRERSTRTLGQHPDATCCASLGVLLGGAVPNDPRDVLHDLPEHVSVTSKGISAKVAWGTNAVSFDSTTAYRKTEFDGALDLDSTDVPAVANFPVERSTLVTQDFQLTSADSGDVSWVAGIFYLREDAFQSLDIELPLFSAFSRPSGAVETEAYAVYGQAAYRATERVRLTAGTRYSRERRAQDFSQVISDPLGAVTGTPGSIELANRESKSWTSWTPKLAAEYFASETLLVYASISEGVKAGGFNSSAFQPAFDPEELVAAEIGIKLSAPSGRTRFNAAAFHYDYSGLQLLTLAPGSPPSAFPIVINAAAATVRGIELQLETQPTNSLRIDSGIALLDATFDDFVSVDPNNPLDDPNRADQPMPQAPRVEANVGVQYEWNFARYGRLTLRTDWRRQASIFLNAFADPAVRQRSYSLVDARAVFERSDARWHVAVFGRNLGDELYAQSRIRQDPLVGALSAWGAPRTYGVELGGRF
jgi:iron complex outermembrane recepter protein